MLRTYLLALLSVSSLVGASKYFEQQNGKGLLARTGVERYLDRQFGSPESGLGGQLKSRIAKLVVAQDDLSNSLGGCH